MTGHTAVCPTEPTMGAMLHWRDNWSDTSFVVVLDRPKRIILLSTLTCLITFCIRLHTHSIANADTLIHIVANVPKIKRLSLGLVGLHSHTLTHTHSTHKQTHTHTHTHTNTHADTQHTHMHTETHLPWSVPVRGDTLLHTKCCPSPFQLMRTLPSSQGKHVETGWDRMGEPSN